MTKQQSKIFVYNSKTGKIEEFSLIDQPEIPTVDQLIQQLQDLIRAEQKRINNQWIKLSRISALYKEEHPFTLSQVVSAHFSDYQASDIFLKNPQHFVIHQPSEKSSSYVTLFEVKPSRSQPILKPTVAVEELPQIQSIEALEDALVNIMEELLSGSTASCVSLSILGSHFNRKYGQAITQVIKQFQPGGKFTKFIDVSDSFRLERNGSGWNVCLDKGNTTEI